MSVFYFIRHGQSLTNDGTENYNICYDPHLTEKGHEQSYATAHILRKALAKKDLTIVTSPLTRCKQTLQPIKEFFPHVEIIQNDNFCELTLATKHIPEDFKHLPLDENLVAFRGRVLQFLDYLKTLAMGDSRNYIFVGHSKFLSLLFTLMNNPQRDCTIGDYIIGNCSITKVYVTYIKEKDSVEYKFCYVNNYTHLPIGRFI